MKVPNRHEYPRRTSYIIAKYTIKEGSYRDVIKNIGAGGLLVKTSRKVAEGQTISLEFPLFDFENLIQATGKVIRCDPNGFAVAFDEPLRTLASKDGHILEIVHESERSSKKS